MGMLSLYDWVLPNKGEYLSRYKVNQSLYNSARELWNSMDSAALFFIIAFIVLGISIACYYYYHYNKKPGRKYKIWQWGLWLGITTVITILLTLGLGWILVQSNLNEKFGFLFRISLLNGGYALIVYFIASFIICNLPIATNAYRFLKIGK